MGRVADFTYDAMHSSDGGSRARLIRPFDLLKFDHQFLVAIEILIERDRSGRRGHFAEVDAVTGRLVSPQLNLLD
jgi:hypothetical protein